MPRAVGVVEGARVETSVAVEPRPEYGVASRQAYPVVRASRRRRQGQAQLAPCAGLRGDRRPRVCVLCCGQPLGIPASTANP